MKITIIGLGLIGGSLGLALKQAHGGEIEVVGYARRAETADRARSVGAIDAKAESLSASVPGSQLVFICTPVLAAEEIMRTLAPHIPEGCVVTDTASTKRQIMDWAGHYLYPRTDFVGGHPMAGREKSGIEAADAALLKGCTYCLTPAEWTGPEQVRLVEAMVKAVGAQPLFIEAEKHDFLVAGVSHLPTLVSAAVVAATTRSVDWPLMARLAATGYRDVTRLASGSPQVNGDIFATNRQAVVHWIDELTRELGYLKGQIANESSNLREELARICEARERWLDTKGSGKC